MTNQKWNLFSVASDSERAYVSSAILFPTAPRRGWIFSGTLQPAPFRKHRPNATPCPLSEPVWQLARIESTTPMMGEEAKFPRSSRPLACCKLRVPPNDATFASFAKELNRRVESFGQRPAELKQPAHAEARLRDDFLNQFFRSPGWDMENRAGHTNDV